MFKALEKFLCLCAIYQAFAQAQPNYHNISAPFEAGTYDFDFVYKFTKYLHGMHRYNSFVIFSQPSSRFRPNFIIVRDFEQALVEDFNVPIIVWSNEKHATLRKNLGLNNLVFVQFNGTTDTILNTVDVALEGLHFTSILFYYKNKNVEKPTMQQIREFFDWCWQRNMLNVALTYQSFKFIPIGNGNVETQPIITNRVYNYSPFPKIRVNDLTRSIERGGGAFILDHIRNVHGYEFYTPVTTSVPYVFLQQTPPNCDPNAPNCKTILSGTTGRLYSEYIKQIHGKMKIHHITNLTFGVFLEKLVLAAAQKRVHIGVHPFSRLSVSLDKTMGSYPIGQTNVCVIVPLIVEHNKAQYFQRPFQPTIWLLIAFTALALIFLHFGLQYGYAAFEKNQNFYSFGEALMTTASMMLDQAYIIEFLYKRSAIYKFFHIFILVMTFVLSNMYSASLTSFLSSVQLGEQINSPKDLLASKLKILMSENEKQVYFERERLPKCLLKSHAKIVEHRTVEAHKENLNTSYAYTVTADQWLMMDFKQKQLAKPLFRIASKELCSTSYSLKLPLQWDSPFDMSLALFFMATQESGLAAKWQDMSIAEAKHLKLIKIVKREHKQWHPLNVKDFYLIAFLISFFWFLALLCYVAELLCYKYLKKKRRRLSLQAFYKNIRRKSLAFKRGSK